MKNTLACPLQKARTRMLFSLRTDSRVPITEVHKGSDTTVSLREGKLLQYGYLHGPLLT